MQQVLSSRSAIYCRFQNSAGCTKLQGDDYAAYSTSMSLIQDTAEAVEAHLGVDFCSDPTRAYLEFWGVMQAIFIQQDAIHELHLTIAGARPCRSGRPGRACGTSGIFAPVIRPIVPEQRPPFNGPSWDVRSASMTE